MDTLDEGARVYGAIHAHEELIAAHAGHHVLATHAFLQLRGEVLEHPVSELMAPGVVGLLEEVQVAQQKHMSIGIPVALISFA